MSDTITLNIAADKTTVYDHIHIAESAGGRDRTETILIDRESDGVDLNVITAVSHTDSENQEVAEAARLATPKEFAAAESSYNQVRDTLQIILLVQKSYDCVTPRFDQSFQSSTGQVTNYRIERKLDSDGVTPVEFTVTLHTASASYFVYIDAGNPMVSGLFNVCTVAVE